MTDSNQQSAAPEVQGTGETLKGWLWGLLSAVLTGAGTSLAVVVTATTVSPQTFNTGSAWNLALIGKMALVAFLVGAGGGLANYLQKSPLSSVKAPLWIAGALALSQLCGCAALSNWWQSDSTQTAARAVLNVVESEALNIGLNALEQYASHGNVSWGNAALSAAPVALRTLEGTPYAGDQAAIQDTVSSWIAASSMKEPVSQQIAQVVASAVAQGANPSAAAEAAARGLDAAVATAPLPAPAAQ